MVLVNVVSPFSSERLSVTRQTVPEDL